MDIHIGLTDEQRNTIADGLKKLLADSYALYVKTHNFHWNVKGSSFASLHHVFEEQYLELAIAIDDIAERVRALGVYVPASFSQFSELTTVEEATQQLDSKEMVRQLMLGQEEIVRTARHLFPTVEAAHDAPTADMLTDRMMVHEKNAWMLRSMLEDSAD
jgi:starvation-inducible DNA-binding protein